MRLWLSVCVLGVACSDSAGPAKPVVPGRMQVQISGSVHANAEWQGFGQLRDVLASDSGDLSLLRGENLQPATADSQINVIVPARLELGQLTIGRYVVGVPVTGPVAYVVIDTLFFASVSGTITVDSAGYPGRPGLTPGVLRGTVTFRAVQLIAGPTGPVETGDTISVHATFAAHWYHYLFPNVKVTLGGGPVVGTSQFSTGLESEDGHGGRSVSWESDFGPSHGFPHDISQELRILAPSVGTVAVSALTPGQYFDVAQWPAVYTALFYRDDPRLGLSTGGTLTITSVLAPTEEFYGEIRGTLTSPLALWTNPTTLSGDTVTANVTFDVQVWPLGGIPATALRRAGRRP